MIIAAVQNFEQVCDGYARIHRYCLVAAVALLALAAVLFFALRIPRVFGELTGRKARKAVRKMQESNSHARERVSVKKKTAYKRQNTSGRKQKAGILRKEEKETAVLTRLLRKP